jgi:hypothetical protein
MAGGTPAELVERYAGKEVIEIQTSDHDRGPLLEQLRAHQDITIEEVEDILYVYVRGENGFDPASLLVDADKVIYRRANLEDVFLKLTGRGLAEGE